MSAPPLVIGPHSPYRGLAPFEDSELDALLFFGRSREVEIVTANLLASRLTVLYGPSGVGKSSLLRAGVMRSLRAAGEPKPAVAICGSWAGDPLKGVEEAARSAVAVAVGREPADAPGGLADRLAAWTAELGSELCLLLDQLEELFLYHSVGDGAGGFLDLLPELVSRPGLRVNVLLGIRADALARLDVFKERIPGLFANALRLEHLDREAARAAIVGPLGRYNELASEAVTIEPALVGAVLNEVEAGRIDPALVGRGRFHGHGVGGAGGIEAPYLQLVMQRVWEVERERGSALLRLSTLRELGGAERIVESNLQRALGALTPAQQDAAADVFAHLVTPSGTKIAHGVTDLASYAGLEERQLEPVLRSLAHERILRPLGENGHAAGDRYEIFHDVLADAVLGWSSRHDADSRLLRERAEARLRQRRLLAVAITALAALVLVTLLAAYAISQRGEARDKARSAEARAFAAGAWAQLDADPELSMLLAVEAARREPSSDVEAVLRRALERSQLRAVLRRPTGTSKTGRDRLRAAAGGTTAEAAGTEVLLRRKGTPLLRLPHRARVAALDFDRHGMLVTAAGKEGFVWDVRREPRLVRRLNGHASGILDVRYSPDGAQIATASTDGTARLWDSRSGQPLATLFGHGNYVTGVVFSPDGAMLATASDDGTARLWEGSTGRPLGVLAGTGGPLTDVRFADRGAVVVTTGADGTVRRWNAYVEPRLVPTSARPSSPRSTAISSRGRIAVVDGDIVRLSSGGAPNAVLRGHGDAVNSVSFSPDGRLLLTASKDHDGRIWDAATGRIVRVLRAHFGPVAAAAFSPDGRWVVTAGPTAAGLWETATGRFVYYLRGHSAPLSAASFTPGGAVVTVDRSGSSRTYRCETCGDLDALLVLAKHRLALTGRRLTPAELARY